MRKELSLVKTELKSFILLLSVLLLTSCGVATRNDTAGSAAGASVTVSSNPTSITTYGLSSITATVRDSTGTLVADGTSVTFSLSASSMGTLSSTTATTSGGTAAVYFTAANTDGSVTITSTSGSLSGSVTISIAATATGAVSLSASPSTISPSNTSAITARVVDSAGNPVVDGTIVSFILDNPALGSISPSSAATSNGNATGTFTASTDTGTVTITATSGTIFGTLAITISGTATSTAATNISLTVTPSSIMTTATSSIQATATTSTGANVVDGTAVTFTLSSSAMGTITSSATTSSGIAAATFTAGATPGTVTITATSGNVSQTAAVVISAPSTGSLEYVSATPQVIGLKGGGQTASSAVIFLVKDINGTPVTDGTQVSFVMSGPSGGKLPANGGEYIGDIDASPTTATGSTVSGNVTVILNSGSVAGPVTIAASVTSGSLTFTASSAVISIGGGAPSASHFNLATTKFNLPGLVTSDSQATISAYIADRFGNYNVLTGTSVSFYAEAGAIDTSNVTDATGKTTVIFRTQAPAPAEVGIWSDTSNPYLFNEFSMITSLNSTYGLTIPTDGTYHPRDGWVTVLASVQGEEAFEDANANGLYDTGETFTDQGEPFIDKNDNGCRNDGATKNCSGVVSASSDPFEEFIDVNGNGVYDGPNGVWDGPGCTDAGCLTSKMIWTSITLAFTGNGYYCAITPSSFAVPNGGSQSFSAMVGDINGNRLVSGTTIAVAATVGTLSGQTSHAVPDGVPSGPSVINFILSDPDSTDTALAAASVVTVTVTSSDVVACPPFTAGGTVD